MSESNVQEALFFAVHDTVDVPPGTTAEGDAVIVIAGKSDTRIDAVEVARPLLLHVTMPLTGPVAVVGATT